MYYNMSQSSQITQISNLLNYDSIVVYYLLAIICNRIVTNIHLSPINCYTLELRQKSIVEIII